MLLGQIRGDIVDKRGRLLGSPLIYDYLTAMKKAPP